MKWEGLAKQIMRRYEATSSEQMPTSTANTSASRVPRLRRRPSPERSAQRVRGKAAISDVLGMTITEAARFFAAIELQGARKIIAEELLKEISHRLTFLLDVGLEYLTLDRATTRSRAARRSASAWRRSSGASSRV